MVSTPVRRQQVAYVCGRGLSVRRACGLLSVARSTLHDESRLMKRNAPVLARMRGLADPLPTLWLSAHPGAAGARRPCDECRLHPSVAAEGRPAGAGKAATATRGREPTPAA